MAFYWHYIDNTWQILLGQKLQARTICKKMFPITSMPTYRTNKYCTCTRWIVWAI